MKSAKLVILSLAALSIMVLLSPAHAFGRTVINKPPPISGSAQ